MGELSIRQIVERCQQGDGQALGLLYTAMHDRLHKVCRHFTTDEATADDLLHDSFILIFSKITTLKDTAKAESWMTTVTRNLAQAWLQRQKQNPTVSLDRLQPSLDVVAPMPMPITYDEVLHLVDALPESYRRVFRLSVLEGMSHQEIAALLNIEPHTSSAQLSRAKLMLRRWLAPMVLLFMAIVLPLGWHLLKEDPKDKSAETVASQKGRKKAEDVQTSDKTTASQTDSEQKKTSSTKYVATVMPAVNTTQEEPTVATADTITLPPSTIHHQPSTINHPQSTIQHQPKSKIQPQAPTLSSHWTVDLAYNGISGSNEQHLPYADANTNDDVYDSVAHHRMPLTVTLSAGYRIDRHWQVGLGLQYIRMTSEMLSGNTYAQFVRQQRVHYLGVPLSVRWHHPLTRRLGAYATANVTLQLPLHATVDNRYVLNNFPVETSTERLHPGQLWSTGLGLGLQYDVTPAIGFFVEPSLQYHFNNGSSVETWQTEHPAAFSLPFGLRFTF